MTSNTPELDEYILSMGETRTGHEHENLQWPTTPMEPVLTDTLHALASTWERTAGEHDLAAKAHWARGTWGARIFHAKADTLRQAAADLNRLLAE